MITKTHDVPGGRQRGLPGARRGCVHRASLQRGRPRAFQSIGIKRKEKMNHSSRENKYSFSSYSYGSLCFGVGGSRSDFH